MNELLTTARRPVAPVSIASPPAPAEACADLQPIALALEMASAAALLTVLTTLARLGCRTTFVQATERQATLRVLAPRRVAHRLLPCLGQLVEVLTVTQGPAAPPPPVARPAAGA
jgi:hypothetical protein